MGQTANLFAQFRNAAGANVRALLDAVGAQLVTQRHAKLAASTLAGLSGQASIQGTGQVTTVGLATTYTGLCLSNPAGSGKNLIVQKINALFAVAAAGQMKVGLITGFAAGGITAHTAALTPVNAMVGVSAAALVAKVDSACTLVGTPAWFKWLAIEAAAGVLAISEDVDGAIVIPPGGYLAIGTDTASGAASLFGSINWEEVAI